MKNLIFIFFVCFTGVIYSQDIEECEVAYISDHYILNTTNDTVIIWVNIRNQESFPTEGAEKYKIGPRERIMVSSLDWSGQFRDPTAWYVFKNNTDGLTRLCDKKNWIFEEISKHQAEYTLTLKPSLEPPCEVLDDSLYFSQIMPEIHFETEEKIHEFTEIEPAFPGGTAAMHAWINANIQYPAEAIQNSIEGRVYVDFLVEKSGELSNIKVMRSPHPLLSDEAVRLISTMPNWSPGEMAGKVVRTRYRLPITFLIRS